MDSWIPVIGETQLLKREPTNPRDKNAVALYKDDAVVGHVPYNLAPYLSRFLARDVNKAFAEVTGERVRTEKRDMGWRYHVYTEFMELRPT